MGNRWHPSECRVCGARTPFVTVSALGLCPTHGEMRRNENLRDLVEHRGPWFAHWRRQMLASFGVITPLDDTGDGG